MKPDMETIVGEQQCPRRDTHPDHTFGSWVNSAFEGRFQCPGYLRPADGRDTR